MALLHGTLDATIYEVKGISYRASGSAPKFLRKFVESIEDTVGIGKGSSRVYATVDLDRARVGRTRIATDQPVDPQWNESFHIYCAHEASDIIFSVKFDNAVGATLIGRAYVPAAEVLKGKVLDRWLPVCDESRKPLDAGTKIRVKVHFRDASADPNWSRGIRSPGYQGVPYTYFPQRQGCKVLLYQDAHVPDGFIPPIPLAGRARHYEAHRCWEDIFDAVSAAKHLVYIAGWSVYTEITLLRDQNRPRRDGGELTVGELLKKKADEGVRVLMLVWDDRTSMDFLKRAGFMATHDQETAAYFQGTRVECVLCPRNSGKQSFFQGAQIDTMFSHHQKFVVVDAEMPEGSHSQKRRIVSFVGGLDLCDGRYDTPYHSLFRTLDSDHKADFYQNCFIEGSSLDKGGPRQPWHDIHSKLEGPIAWDVLQNFEERWKKQGGKDLLLHLEEISHIIARPSAVTDPEDRETWNVQLFRSIDGGAAFNFPENADEATARGLVSGKENVLDRSIQDAYIHAIRRAKDFIYIENQYFIGSCYGWQSPDIKDEDIGALNLIPKELSLKICSKIEAGERFAVYVVIPMWPEGVPEKGTMQEILDWQRRTIQMMYRDIAAALRRKGVHGANPMDYLSFFCLGNREVPRSNEHLPSGAPEPNSNYDRAQRSRRFMIYVHSKMMIVDDEYIIVGSANINQRSMDGGRDSEIAMGAYQPHHLSAKRDGHPRGQIHGFRVALWYEHLGMVDDAFYHPESLDCARKVNRAAEKYWHLYMDGELARDLPGHLLTYPISVGADGKVSAYDGVECFPDTNAPILGSSSFYLPDIATT